MADQDAFDAALDALVLRGIGVAEASAALVAAAGDVDAALAALDQSAAAAAAARSAGAGAGGHVDTGDDGQARGKRRKKRRAKADKAAAATPTPSTAAETETHARSDGGGSSDSRGDHSRGKGRKAKGNRGKAKGRAGGGGDGATGHIDKRDKIKAKAQQKKADRQACWLCGGTGHSRKQCPGVEDGGRGQSTFRGMSSGARKAKREAALEAKRLAAIGAAETTAIDAVAREPAPPETDIEYYDCIADVARVIEAIQRKRGAVTPPLSGSGAAAGAGAGASSGAGSGTAGSGGGRGGGTGADGASGFKGMSIGDARLTLAAVKAVVQARGTPGTGSGAATEPLSAKASDRRLVSLAEVHAALQLAAADVATIESSGATPVVIPPSFAGCVAVCNVDEWRRGACDALLSDAAPGGDGRRARGSTATAADAADAAAGPDGSPAAPTGDSSRAFDVASVASGAIAPVQSAMAKSDDSSVAVWAAVGIPPQHPAAQATALREPPPTPTTLPVPRDEAGGAAATTAVSTGSDTGAGGDDGGSGGVLRATNSVAKLADVTVSVTELPPPPPVVSDATVPAAKAASPMMVLTHTTDGATTRDELLAAVESAALTHPLVKAIGVVGLDFSDACDPFAASPDGPTTRARRQRWAERSSDAVAEDHAAQVDTLRQQMRIAARASVPVIVSLKGPPGTADVAFYRTFVLQISEAASAPDPASPDARVPTVVLHCTEAMLSKPTDEMGLLLKLRKVKRPRVQLYFAFSGSITFSKASRELRNLVFDVPLDNVLLGTGAPAMLPAPLAATGHARTCTPADAIFVAQALAAAKGCDVDDVLRAARSNTRAVFGV